MESWIHWRVGLHRGCKSFPDVKSNMSFESEAAWVLINKTVEAMRGCLDKEFVLKQKDTTVDDVRRALESCARAAKPREPMVLHSLRRAMYLMSQSMSNIILLRPLIRALSIRDTETAKVAGGMLLILEFSPPITATWSEMLYCSDRGTKR